MADRPMLMSAPMVRAILAGTKTQTRRVAKIDNTMGRDSILEPRRGCTFASTFLLPEQATQASIFCPYGQPGDRLWVREAWRVIDLANCFAPREITAAHRIWYEADGPHEPPAGRYRPGMFMPRWASRITLEVTDVRVERLQDISEADAQAEGIERGQGFPGWYRGPLPGDSAGLEPHGRDFKIPTAFPKLAYRALWESINGPGSWDANPWVWVVDFKRVTP